MENIHERSGRAGGDMGKVLAAILDFLMVFFGAGYAIGLLTGNVTADGFKLEGAPANQMVKLMEALEDHDDVQKVSANFDMNEADMAAA